MLKSNRFQLNAFLSFQSDGNCARFSVNKKWHFANCSKNVYFICEGSLSGSKKIFFTSIIVGLSNFVTNDCNMKLLTNY